MMNACLWEEIHGFQSLGEYQRFVQYIESQIRLGQAEEVEPEPNYHKDFVYGGRWFKDIRSDEIWRLVPPDFPFRGLWEPICEKSSQCC